MPPEPVIVINGHPLTEAQATTVRVGLTLWHMDLAPRAKRKALGPIGEGYWKALGEVVQLLVTPPPPTVPDEREAVLRLLGQQIKEAAAESEGAEELARRERADHDLLLEYDEDCRFQLAMAHLLGRIAARIKAGEHVAPPPPPAPFDPEADISF